MPKSLAGVPEVRFQKDGSRRVDWLQKGKAWGEVEDKRRVKCFLDLFFQMSCDSSQDSYFFMSWASVTMCYDLGVEPQVLGLDL